MCLFLACSMHLGNRNLVLNFSNFLVTVISNNKDEIDKAISSKSKCDACDVKFSIGHALAFSCKVGGHRHWCHDAISYELKSLDAIALGKNSVQIKPLINLGSTSEMKLKIKAMQQQ